jgi:hypothetical protein
LLPLEVQQLLPPTPQKPGPLRCCLIIISSTYDAFKLLLLFCAAAANNGGRVGAGSRNR